MRIEKIVVFLMLNIVFPRSVNFSLLSIETHLKNIRRDLEYLSLSDKSIRFTAKIRANLAYLEWEEIEKDRLPEILADVSSSSNQLGLVISNTFFRKGVLGA
jgi:uncharacterized alpha-E superfamily protein